MGFTTEETTKLKNQIVEIISDQGFSVNGQVTPKFSGKEGLKFAHQKSRKEQLHQHRTFLKRNISKVQKYTLSGQSIHPEKIKLRLIEVHPSTIEETLFRWWNLVWWSMPYQRAYGRQMRFIIWDEYHNAPFGLIGLQSPVLKMAVRDKYLNIPKDELDIWVNKSMQAQRVGALPPYNDLLGGKLVALALGSNEIRTAYYRKYCNRETLLEKRKIDADLLFITTSSAYGRSSIYNRLKFDEEEVAHKLGYTKGYGTFHIPDSLFAKIKDFLKGEGIDTGTTFGNGPSRRIKLLYQAFAKLNLPDYSQHQIQREYYLFSHVSNLRDIIHEGDPPNYWDRSFGEMFIYWKNRWCLPRSVRKEDWRNFDPQRLQEEIIKL